MCIIRQIKSNNGSAMVIFALILTLILGFSALGIDMGRVAVEKAKFQNAIDAAALAGAQDLKSSSYPYDNATMTAAKTTAKNYSSNNGYSLVDGDITFAENSITIIKTTTVDYIFAKIFGLATKQITVRATAEIGSLGAAFDYAYFSGSQNSTLSLTGSHQSITGNVHSNKDFVASGSNSTITGSCEAVTTVTVGGSNMNINDRQPNSPIISMPDFSSIIKAQAEKAGHVYIGDQTFDSANLNLDEPIYVEGNVTINGSHFSGKGCILATGNITFNGSNLKVSSSDAICFYSQNGNIRVNGSHSTIEGILYAPNGDIQTSGSNQTINGRIISNTVTTVGSGLIVKSDPSDLVGLKSIIKSVKLVE